MTLKLINTRVLISLVALTIIALMIYFLGPYLSIHRHAPLASQLNRIISITVLFIVWLAALLIAFTYRRIKERKLISLFVKNNNESEHSHKLADLNENIIKVIKSLKQMKFKGKNKRGYSLYHLPWYFTLGAPASGKSTLINNAGLFLPIQEYLSKEDAQNIKTNHGYEWWVSDQAVFIEISRFMQAPSWDNEQNRDAWLHVLKQLKAHRGSHNMNGIIVLINAAMLIEFDEDTIQQQIKAAKQYMIDIKTRFKVALPIYIFISQCDQIVGFDDYFSHVDSKLHDEILGITFPLSHKTDVVQYFDNKFDELIARIKSHSLKCLHPTVSAQRNNHAAIFFPHRLSLLKTPIQYLVDAVLGETVNINFPLRGIYFCSAKQATPSYDILSDAIAKNFHLDTPTITARDTTQSSFFLKNVFQKIILPEASISENTNTNKLKALSYHLSYFVMALIFMISLGYISNSYLSSQESMARLDNQIHLFNQQQTVAAEKSETLADIAASFAPMVQEYNQLQKTSQSLSSAPMMPFYEKLIHSLQLALGNQISVIFTPKFRQLVTDSISEDSDPLLIYHYLLFYTKISQQKPLALNKENSVNHILQYIASGNQDTAKFIMQLLQFPSNQTLTNIEDEPAKIKALKLKLSHTSASQLAYMTLKSDYLYNNKSHLYYLQDAAKYQEIARRIFAQNSNQQRILGLYTKKGYQNYFLKQQALAITDVNNGLQTLQLPANAEAKQMSVLYTVDYIAAWSSYLSQYHIRHFNSLQKIINMLNDFADADSPVLWTLRTAAKNTALTINFTNHTISDKFALLREIFKKPKAKTLNLWTQTTQAVNALANLLTEIQSSPEPDRAAFNTMKSLVAEKTPKSPITVFHEVLLKSPEPLKAWLSEIEKNVLEVLFAMAKSNINVAWQFSVAPTLKQDILNRYPIDATSNDEISAEAFSHFFGPHGTLDSFFAEFIQPFVNTQHDIWHRKRIYGYSIGISPEIIYDFKKFQTLQQEFFANQAKQANVNFSIKPMKLSDNSSSLTLALNTTNLLTYRHGPLFTTEYHWPSDTTKQLNIIFNNFAGATYTQSFYGVWAWFKLLEQYPPAPTNQKNSYLITINYSNHQAILMITSKQVNLSRLLYNLKQLHFPADIK